MCSLECIDFHVSVETIYCCMEFVIQILVLRAAYSWSTKSREKCNGLEGVVGVYLKIINDIDY